MFLHPINPSGLGSPLQASELAREFPEGVLPRPTAHVGFGGGVRDAIRRRLLNHAPADVTERNYTVLNDAERLREFSEKVDRLLLGKADLQT